MMAAAAAVAAAGVAEVFGGGNAAGFERFGDVFLNRVLKVVKFLLRIKETARDGIGQQCVAMFLEIGDFRAVQGQRNSAVFPEAPGLWRSGFRIGRAPASLARKASICWRAARRFGRSTMAWQSSRVFCVTGFSSI